MNGEQRYDGGINLDKCSTAGQNMKISGSMKLWNEASQSTGKHTSKQKKLVIKTQKRCSFFPLQLQILIIQKTTNDTCGRTTNDPGEQDRTAPGKL